MVPIYFLHKQDNPSLKELGILGFYFKTTFQMHSVWILGLNMSSINDFGSSAALECFLFCFVSKSLLFTFKHS